MPSDFTIPRHLTQSDKLFCAFLQTRKAPRLGNDGNVIPTPRLEPLERHPNTRARAYSCPHELDPIQAKRERKRERRRREAKEGGEEMTPTYLFGIPMGVGLPQTPKGKIEVPAPCLPSEDQRMRGELNNHTRKLTEAVLPWLRGPKHGTALMDEKYVTQLAKTAAAKQRAWSSAT